MTNPHRSMLGGPWALAALCALATVASAQPSPSLVTTPPAAAPSSSATPATSPAKAKGEVEFLVAPGGGAYEVPIHALQVCVLSFPEDIASSAITSTRDLEVNPWGKDSVAVRGNANTKTATLALATTSGHIKINVTFRVVPANEEALTLVRFKAVSAEDAFEDKLKEEMAKRLAPIQAEIEATRKGLEDQIVSRAENLIADRSLKRSQVVTLKAHARNDDHVIAHVERALLLGDDASLFFEIQNRSRAPFRLASATVFYNGQPVNGLVRFPSAATAKDAALLGVVPAGASVRGVIVIRSAAPILRKSLTLELRDATGRGTIRVSDEIVLP